jgi:23S rRNA (guanosine2251-2'-O)-methyltransferase
MRNAEGRRQLAGNQPRGSGVLAGIHPVREALKAGRTLDRILVARGAGGPRLQEIIDLAREHSVPVRFEPREALDRASNNATHQGVVAFGAAERYADLDQVQQGAQLLVLLDGVEDPHNLGAIIRTAHAAGAAAVLVPDRRAAGLTETVAKAAAGALEHLPVVRIGNVTQTLESLKAKGFWILVPVGPVIRKVIIDEFPKGALTNFDSHPVDALPRLLVCSGPNCDRITEEG